MASLTEFITKRELGFRNLRYPIDSRAFIGRLECAELDVAQVAENEGNPYEQVPIYDMKFCPIQFHPELMGVTDELGFVYIVTTQADVYEEDKVVLRNQCHENALVGIDWSPFVDGTLATCSGDKTVKLWDLKSDFATTATLSGHERSVKSVKFHPGNRDFLASCGRDGSIRFWDSRKENGETNVIRNAHGVEKKQCQVADIVFLDDNTIISCGVTDSSLRMWDIRKTYSHLKKVHPLSLIKGQCNDAACTAQGFFSLHLDCMSNLYASAFHKILKFNLSVPDYENALPAQYVAPDALGAYVKVSTSTDGRFLISGSTAAEVYVWDTCSPDMEPFTVLKSNALNENVASSVAQFCPNDTFKIVCASDEGRIQIWRPRNTNNQNLKPAITASVLSDQHKNDIQCYTERCKKYLVHVTKNIEDASCSKLRRKNQFGEFDPPSAPTAVDYKPSNDSSRDKVSKILADLPNYVMDGKHPSFYHLLLRGRKKVPKRQCWLGKIKLLPREASDKRTLDISSYACDVSPNAQNFKRLRLSETNQNAASPPPLLPNTPSSRKKSASRLKTGNKTPRSRSSTPVPRTTPSRTPNSVRGRKSIRSETCSSPKILQFCVPMNRTEAPASPSNGNV